MEQLRREFVQIIAPINPRMRTGGFEENGVEPVFLEHFNRGPRGVDQKIVFAGAEPKKLQPFLQVGVVQNGLVLFLPAWTFRRWRIGPRNNSENARAIHTDVGELLEMGDGDVQGLSAAH